jgi:hypothetical protein
LCSEIRANADGKIDHLFIDVLVQRITYELRVCRDVYRKHLEEMQLESMKRCHLVAYEYVVAPRAAERLRRALLEYFHCADVSFDSLQMLFDPFWPQPPLRPTDDGWKEGAFAKDFDELMLTLIPPRVFQGLNDKIGVGNPFDSYHLRRLAPHGAVKNAIEIYKAESKDPSLVRDTMGHEDLKTTMEYMHPDVGRIKAIIDAGMNRNS